MIEPAEQPASECPDKEVLFGFLAGELDSEAARSVEMHLSECERCEAIVAIMLDETSLESPPQILDEDQEAAEKIDEIRDLQRRLYEIHGHIRLDEVDNPDSTNATKSLDTGDKTFSSIEDGTRTDIPRHRLRRVGRFLLRNEVGRGGFGIVYQAFDSVLNRVVALKVGRSVVPNDPGFRDQFIAEAQAAARLNHPNIIPIFEAGEYDGIIYLAMEYCAGDTLDKWIRQQDDIAVETAVEIVKQLAEATAHAHDTGLYHRDIKPGNILLDPKQHSGRLRFTPRLTDFGLARFQDDSGRNSSSDGVLAGTPKYMAPEQATGKRNLYGPHTDVYALGVILYQLLTGRVPIEGENSADTLRRIVVENTTAPSTLRRGLPRDLDAICACCLNKSATGRYDTGRELAADLRRLQRGEQTRARPLTSYEIAGRWIARNRGISIWLAAMTMFFLVFSIGMLIHLENVNQINRELENSERKLAGQSAQLMDSNKQRLSMIEDLAETVSKLQTYRYHAKIALADEAWRNRDLLLLDRLLNELRPKAGEQDLRGIEWRRLRFLSRTSGKTAEFPDDELYFVGSVPHKNWFATAGANSTVRILNSTTLQPVKEIFTDQDEVNSFCFSEDGSRMLTAGDNATVKVWNTASWTCESTIEVLREGQREGERLQAFSVLMVPGADEFIVSGTISNAQRYSLDGKLLRTYVGKGDVVESTVIDPEGKFLATADHFGVIRYWDLEENKPLSEIQAHSRHAYGVCMIPGSGGKRVISCGDSEELLVLDLEQRKELEREKHLDPVLCVAISGDGLLVASGDKSGTIQTWDMGRDGTLTRRDAWRGHEGRVYSLMFPAGSNQLISVGSDGRLAVWPIFEEDSEWEFVLPEKSTGGDGGSTCVPGTSTIAATYQGAIKFWNVESGELEKELSAPGAEWRRIGHSLNGEWFAAGSYSGEVIVWKKGDAEIRYRFRVHENEHVGGLSLSDDGSLLAVVIFRDKNNDIIRLFDTGTGTRLSWLNDRAGGEVAVSPDGKYVALGLLNSNSVQLWEVESKNAVAEFYDHKSTVTAVRFDRSGTRVASGSGDRQIYIYDVAARKRLQSLSGHEDEVNDFRFSENGRSLISVDENSSSIIWDTDLGLQYYEVYRGPELLDVGLSESVGLIMLNGKDERWTILRTVTD